MCPHCMKHMCMRCSETHVDNCPLGGSENDEVARSGVMVVAKPDELEDPKEKRGSSDEEVWINIYGDGGGSQKSTVRNTEDCRIEVERRRDPMLDNAVVTFRQMRSMLQQRGEGRSLVQLWEHWGNLQVIQPSVNQEDRAGGWRASGSTATTLGG